MNRCTHTHAHTHTHTHTHTHSLFSSFSSTILSPRYFFSPTSPLVPCHLSSFSCSPHLPALTIYPIQKNKRIALSKSMTKSQDSALVKPDTMQELEVDDLVSTPLLVSSHMEQSIHTPHTQVLNTEAATQIHPQTTHKNLYPTSGQAMYVCVCVHT